MKVPIDAREKVGHVWLVDPLPQTLEVVRLDGPGYRLAGVWRGDVIVQCEPFEALSIRLADLCQRKPQRAPYREIEKDSVPCLRSSRRRAHRNFGLAMLLRPRWLTLSLSS